MSADVVERAESAIARGFVLPESLGLTRELIDALKAARVEERQWVAVVQKHFGVGTPSMLESKLNRRLRDD